MVAQTVPANWWGELCKGSPSDIGPCYKIRPEPFRNVTGQVATQVYFELFNLGLHLRDDGYPSEFVLVRLDRELTSKEIKTLREKGYEVTPDSGTELHFC